MTRRIGVVERSFLFGSVLLGGLLAAAWAVDDQPRVSGDGQPRVGGDGGGQPSLNGPPASGGQPQASSSARAVPLLVGLPAKDARAALTAAGFTVRFQLGDPAPSKDKELTVYAVEPPTGSAVSAGSTVQITVYSTSLATGTPGAPAVVTPPTPSGLGGQPSLRTPPTPGGPPDTAGTDVAVPSIIGLSSKEARALLLSAGLSPRFHLGVGPAVENLQFTVYSQSPGAQAVLARQEEVDLFVHAKFGQPTTLGDQLFAATAVPFLDQSTQEIDPRTGRMTLVVTDLSTPAGAVRLDVVRAFSRQADGSGMLGARWRLNWECRVSQAGPRAYVEEGGERFAFALDEATEQYLSDAGGKLVFGPDRTVWTRDDGRARSFDLQGRLVESHERNGNIVTLQYDAQGRLERVAGPYNAELRFTHNDRGRVTRIENSTGATVTYAYEPVAAGAADGDLAPSTYEYDAQGAITRLTTPFAGATQLVYDGRGRITHRRWSDGAEERYVYDDAAQTTRYVDPQQNVTMLSWKETDHLEESTSLLGDKVSMRTDDAGRPLEITGPTGLKAKFTYDDLGRPTSIESPANGITRLEYLGDTRLATSIVGPDTQQSLEYDANGNLIRVTDALNPTENASFEYFADGQIAKLILADGQERRFTYDEHGRLATVADALGNLWRFEYDERGNLVRDTAPDGGVTSRTFDEHNRLASVTDALGGLTKYVRARSGGQLVVTITDPNGGVTRSIYNARNRLVSVTDPQQRTTKYDYDVAGRLVRVTNPAGKLYQYQYDALGNLVGEVNPEGAVTRRTFDAVGRVTSVVDPAGNSTSFEYSPTGQLSRLVDSSGRPMIFSYDAAGRLTAAVSALGTTRYERSSAGLVAQVIPPHGQVQAIEYDNLGNVLRIKQAEELLVEYDYNAFNRRVKERLPGSPEVAYRYDGLQNLVGLEREGSRVSLENDGSGRPGATLDDEGAAARLAYTPHGRLLAATDPQGNQSRAFDAANLLVSISAADGTPSRFEYDATGRIAGASPPGAVASAFTYDALRNHLRCIDTVTGQTRATYDCNGRLLSVTDAGGQTAWLTDQSTAEDQEVSPLDAILASATPPGSGGNRNSVPQWQPSCGCVCTNVCYGMGGVVGWYDGGWEPRRWLFPRFQRLYGGMPLGDVEYVEFDDGWSEEDDADWQEEQSVLGPNPMPALSDLLKALRAAGLTPGERQRALRAVAMADNTEKARRLEAAAEARRKAAAEAAAAAERARIAAQQQQFSNQGGYYQDDWGYDDYGHGDWGYDDYGHDHGGGWGGGGFDFGGWGGWGGGDGGGWGGGGHH